MRLTVEEFLPLPVEEVLPPIEVEAFHLVTESLMSYKQYINHEGIWKDHQLDLQTSPNTATGQAA